MEAGPRALPPATALFPILVRSRKEAAPGGPQDLRLLPKALQKTEKAVAVQEHRCSDSQRSEAQQGRCSNVLPSQEQASVDALIF